MVLAQRGKEEISAKMQRLLHLELVREGRVADGKAADLLGISQAEFLTYMEKHRVSPCQFTPMDGVDFFPPRRQPPLHGEGIDENTVCIRSGDRQEHLQWSNMCALCEPNPVLIAIGLIGGGQRVTGRRGRVDSQVIDVGCGWACSRTGNALLSGARWGVRPR